MAEEVVGLRAFLSDLARIEKGIAVEARAAIIAAGEVVADEARDIAETKGLIGNEATDHGAGHPGALVGRIVVRVKSSVVYIMDLAMRKSRAYPQGFSYPTRLEFENGGARAFLLPALEAKGEAAADLMLGVIDKFLGG